MGQKVNPHGLRVGVIQDWDAKWIADKKNFAKFIKEDDTIRTFLKKKYYQAGISKIVVERAEGKVTVKGEIAVCSLKTLEKDCKMRTPAFYLFWRE